MRRRRSCEASGMPSARHSQVKRRANKAPLANRLGIPH